MCSKGIQFSFSLLSFTFAGAFQLSLAYFCEIAVISSVSFEIWRGKSVFDLPKVIPSRKPDVTIAVLSKGRAWESVVSMPKDVEIINGFQIP